MLHITPWERSALQMLATGMTTAQLATAAGLSECDIQERLRALFGRMGAASERDALTVALRRGLIPAAPAHDA